MNIKLLRNLLWVPMCAVALFITSNLSAATFTAVASGNWSSSATWAGGVSPGMASANDVIVIGSAFTVNLDQNVEIDGLLSSLQVDGSLTTSNSSDLRLTQGTILGSGEIMVDELTLGTLAIVTFGGDITANSLSSAATTITLVSNITVEQSLNLTAGVLSIGTGGMLMLQNNSSIVIDGGSLSLTGSGALDLTSNYNVVYNGNSTTGGLELTGSGLDNVTINLDDAGQALTLSSDLTVNGMLQLQGGQFNTGGNDITLNGGFMVSGNGSVVSSNGSDFTLGGSIGGTLVFSSTANSVNDFTINLPASATVTLGSDLNITGDLSNTSGTLDISDVDLTVSGDVTGNGTFMANGNSGLMLDGNTTISGDLNIETTGSSTGGIIGDLEIDLASGNSVMLGNDLTVSGMLTLDAGSFSLNGNTLTLTGNLSGSGNGTIGGGSGSSLEIMAGGNVTGDITFTSGSEMLEDLIIELDNNGSVSLGSNVTINGMLDLTSGNLNTNGNTITVGAGADVMINSDATVLGTGNFNGSAGYDLTIMGDGDVNIGIFGSGSGMNDLVIDLDNSTASATIGNDIVVNGTLDLMGGSLDLNGNDLTVNGDVMGGVSGSISSDASSSITINTSTSTTGGLSFSSTGNTVGSLTVNVQDGGNVSILNDLTVTNSLNLDAGMVVLSDGDLTIASGGSISGAGINNYVVTTGEGSLMLEIASSSSATFDVGTMTEYTPATITSNGSATGMFGVHVMDQVLSNGTTGSVSSSVNSVVAATWFVESSLTAGVDVDLEVEWSSAMEVNGFDSDSAYISHYINGAWDVDAAATATAEGSGRFSLTRTGITSFSPFAVFDKDASVGIREIAAVEDLNVFPNPAMNFINIPFAQGFEAPATVRIIDLNGATVIELSREAYEDVSVDVGSLTDGMYMVKVIGDDYVSTGRFIKN